MTPIRDIIHAYHATPDEEICRMRMLALLESTGSCRRTHFIPGHFTASAIILSPDKLSTLLIYHRKLQRWLQPGGHIEIEDASIVHAAAREVIEECGVHVDIKHARLVHLDIHTIPETSKEPAHEHFDIRFAFVSNDWEMKAGAEVENAQWFSIAEITPDKHEASLCAAIQRARM